jgi:hypothetical protein
VVPRGEEDSDGVRLDAVKLNVWPVWSCSSWSGREAGLEELTVPVCFGRGRGLRFPAFLPDLVASVRAPEDRKNTRDQRRWRSTSQSSESTGRSCSNGGLRREI